jgi:hypothetical protein
VVEFIGACMDPEHLMLVMELVGGGDAMTLLCRDDVQISWERRLRCKSSSMDCDFYMCPDGMLF